MREFLLTMAAMTISVLSMPLLLRTSDTWRSTVAATQAAQVAAELGDATKAYIATNYRSITSGQTVTLQTLQSGNFLPSSRTGCTAYGCTWVIQITQPGTNTYEALVMSNFQNALPDRVANVIASNIGAMGGLIPQNDSRTFNDAVGNNNCNQSTLWSGKAVGASWATPLRGYSTTAKCGQVAVLVNFDSTIAEDLSLHRSYVNGLSDYNTLNTPLILGPSAQRVIGATCGTITATDAAPKGSLTADANGNLLTCDGIKWTQPNNSVWKGPASANWTALNALPASGNTIGDTRITADNNRAYSWNGSTWVAIGFDKDGNLTIPGNPNAATCSLSSTGCGKGAIFLKTDKGPGYTGLVANGDSGDLAIIPETSNSDNGSIVANYKFTGNGFTIPTAYYNATCNSGSPLATAATRAPVGSFAYDPNLNTMVVCRSSPSGATDASGNPYYHWYPVGGTVQGFKAEISTNGGVIQSSLTNCPSSGVSTPTVKRFIVPDPTSTGPGDVLTFAQTVPGKFQEYKGTGTSVTPVTNGNYPFTMYSICIY